MKDLISVIVPVYNVEKYIDTCINSIINQTYTNLEIILIDDGSTDNSGKLCDVYSKKDNRIKVIHKLNGGVSLARNIGIEEATGNWIMFVDSDDWIENECCEIMLNAARDTKIDCVICGYNKIYNQKQEKINCKEDKITYSNEEFLNKVLNVQSGYGFCHTKLIKKEIIKDIKFDEQLKVGEDALFNIYMADNIKNVFHIGIPLYNYRINCESVVRKYDVNYLNNYLKSMQKANEYILNKYNKNNVVKQNINNYIMYHLLLIIINYCCNPKNNLSFFKQVKLICKTCNIEEFKIAIKKSNYKELSLTRKITLFTLKYKLYYITCMIGKVRQHQLKNGEENNEKK